MLSRLLSLNLRQPFLLQNVHDLSIILPLLARDTRLGQVRRLFPLTHANL